MLNVLPPSRLSEENPYGPLASVTSWATAPSKRQVRVEPRSTIRLRRLKEELSTATVGSPGAKSQVPGGRSIVTARPAAFRPVSGTVNGTGARRPGVLVVILRTSVGNAPHGPLTVSS